MNASFKFPNILDVLLNRYNLKSCPVYLYYNIIFSKDPGTHLLDLDKVLAPFSR